MLEKLEKFQIEIPNTIYGGTATDDLAKWRKS